MKTVKGTIILAGFAALASFTALPAFAADAPAAAAMPAFGVVDMNKVMQVTDAAKNVFSQLESKRKEYQTQIAKEEDALRAADQDIRKQKESLTKEAFEKKHASFEEKVMEGQKMVQSRKRILDQAFNASLANLRRQAAKVVAEVAQEKHFSAVFTQDAVMISTPDLDITDAVIERMNKQVKKINVDWAAASEESSEKSGKKK